MNSWDIIADVIDVNNIHEDVHVDGDGVIVDVHDDAHVVHVIANNDDCHSWADPESFWFQAQLRVDIHVDVHL